MSITPHYIDVKTLIRKHEVADAFTTSRFSFSPYRACEHGCRYCDGRAERYYVEGDFERDIVIRKNAPELLSRELPKLRERGILGIGSGVSDAYQPVETRERIMAQCASILARHNRPVAVMTKSALVERDLDAWAQINAKSRFRLGVSLAFTDDTLRRTFEPGCGSVDERLSILRRFKEAGCVTGVLAMPLLPFITDTDAHLAVLGRRLKEANPDYVIPAGLTLRPGVQKETFFTVLREKFPDLLPGYIDIYGENKPSGMVCADYQKEHVKRLRRFMSDLSLPGLIPHAAYRDVIALYDEVHVLLAHMVELYNFRGVETGPLSLSLERFAAWVKQERSAITRRRTRSFAEIEDHLRFACTTGEIEGILGNARLADFVKRVVVDRRVFDYISLRLL